MKIPRQMPPFCLIIDPTRTCFDLFPWRFTCSGNILSLAAFYLVSRIFCKFPLQRVRSCTRQILRAARVVLVPRILPSSFQQVSRARREFLFSFARIRSKPTRNKVSAINIIVYTQTHAQAEFKYFSKFLETRARV